MRIRQLLTICILGVGLYSCANTFDAVSKSGDINLQYKKALQYFEAKKYQKAADLLEELDVALSGTAVADTALYYKGLSFYGLKDYETAAEAFGEFVNTYGRSPFTPRAAFLRLDCMYNCTYRYELDQLPTKETIAAITEYMYDYPNNDYMDICKSMLDDLNGRLDKKDFEAARMYYDIEDYKAAIKALKETLKSNPDNRYREELMYYTLAAVYKFADLSVIELRKERFLTVIDEYYNFIGEYPESVHRRSADSMYRKALRVTGKESAVELEDDGEEAILDDRKSKK